MVQILKFFGSLMERPTNYGWFHLMYIGLVIVGTFLLVFFGKDMKRKNYKLTLLIIWIVLLSLEIFKQLTWSIDWDLSGSMPKFVRYQWYTFPFQMCATPMVVLPFIIFTDNTKIEDACCAYLMTFALFAGLAVMVFPNDVFVQTISINIQTMTYHGLMVLLGIFLAVYKRRDLSIKYFLGALVPYTALICVAVLLNETVYFAIPNESFNMFYISTHYDSTLPVVQMLNGKVSPVIRIFIYYLVFIFLAFVVYMIVFFFSSILPNLIIKVRKEKTA